MLSLSYKTVFSALLFLIFGLLAMGKAAEAVDFWYDDLTGTAGNQPIGWGDETQNGSYNAEIAFSYTFSYAAITRTASSNNGQVWSPLQNCDVDDYPIVEIEIARISSSATWQIGIRDSTEPLFWPLNSLTSETGTFAFNYKNETGWSADQSFYIFIKVDGGGGEFIEVDFVRICDVAVTPTYTNTMTFTETPTSTPSSTETPDWTSTMTPTLTPTPTASQTPTPTEIQTATETPSFSPTSTETVIWTSTHTPTATPTWTPDLNTSTYTPTATPTWTPDLNTSTHTPTATLTRTPDLNTSTHTPTATLTRTPDLNTSTHTPTVTPTSTSTEVVGTPTNTPMVSPVPTNTPMATATEIPPGVFDKNLEFIRVNRKTITPDGSMDRELEIYFRSQLSSHEIKVSIFNINGRRQAILEVAGNSPDYRANWQGNNESGQALPAGIYIYEIKAGDSAYRGAVVLAR